MKFSPIAAAVVSSCLVFFHLNPASAVVIDAGATPEDAASVPLDEPDDATAAVVIDAGATPEDAASVVGPGRRRTLVAKKKGSDRDEHGCITSAGYSWCASLDKCIRPFDTECLNTLPVTPVDQEFDDVSLIAVDVGQPSCSWNDLNIVKDVGLGILSVVAFFVAPVVAAPAYVALAAAGFNDIISAFQTRTCTSEDAKKVWVSDAEMITEVINKKTYAGDLNKYEDFQTWVAGVTKRDPNYFQTVSVDELYDKKDTYLSPIVDNCESYLSDSFNLHEAVVAAQLCGQVYIHRAHFQLLILSKQASSDCIGTLDGAKQTVLQGINYLEATHRFFYANATYEEAPKETMKSMKCESNEIQLLLYPYPFCDGFVCTSTPRNYMVPDFSADAYPGTTQLPSHLEPTEEYARWKFQQGARLQRDRWWWGDGTNKTIGAAYSYNILADMNSDRLQGLGDFQDVFSDVFGKLCGANLNATGQQQQQCSLSPNVSCTGRDIVAAPGSLATDCCNGCNKVPGCTAFTHDQFNSKGEQEGTCYFKSSCNSKVPNSNAVSGVLGGTIPTWNKTEIACNGKVVSSCGECLRPDPPLPILVNYTHGLFFPFSSGPNIYLEEDSIHAAKKCWSAVWQNGPFSGWSACEYQSGRGDTVPRCVRRGYCTSCSLFSDKNSCLCCPPSGCL